MQTGYAYEYHGPNWQAVLSYRWDVVVYTPTGTEELVGSRHIDGALCRVFLCPDGLYRAQTVAACGGAR